MAITEVKLLIQLSSEANISSLEENSNSIEENLAFKASILITNPEDLFCDSFSSASCTLQSLFSSNLCCQNSPFVFRRKLHSPISVSAIACNYGFAFFRYAFSSCASNHRVCMSSNVCLISTFWDFVSSTNLLISSRRLIIRVSECWASKRLLSLARVMYLNWASKPTPLNFLQSCHILICQLKILIEYSDEIET